MEGTARGDREEAGTPQVPREEDLKRILSLLRGLTGVDFSHYKLSTINRRIARRMVLHKFQKLSQYVQKLQQNPAEVEALFHDILINVTSFFREPEAFQVLKKKVFPKLVKNKPAEAPIRIWVPGCSTGEEVYSLAICLTEFLEQLASGARCRCLGQISAKRP